MGAQGCSLFIFSCTATGVGMLFPKSPHGPRCLSSFSQQVKERRILFQGCTSHGSNSVIQSLVRCYPTGKCTFCSRQPYTQPETGFLLPWKKGRADIGEQGEVSLPHSGRTRRGLNFSEEMVFILKLANVASPMSTNNVFSLQNRFPSSLFR